MGALCLLNYAYQLCTYLATGACFLNGYTITPHMLLHLSSFIFRVLHSRPTGSRMSMFIWRELQIHSLIFAYRACIIILYPQYAQVITLGAMITADITSHYCGTVGVSTVRGRHERAGKRHWVKELTAGFFSMSQIGATFIVSGMFQPHASSILVFCTLPPIQTSAFGMTLIRKNLISQATWTMIYSIELLMVYLIWYLEYGNFNIVSISFVTYMVRRMGVSKYVIWLSLFAINHQVRSGQHSSALSIRMFFL